MYIVHFVKGGPVFYLIINNTGQYVLDIYSNLNCWKAKHDMLLLYDKQSVREKQR